MFGNNKKIFSLFSIILAVVVFCRCSATTGSRALTYKEPVSDPDYHVNRYNPDKAFKGTTLFFDIHKSNRPRIIEMDMQGRIVWEYVVPWNMKQSMQPGPDVECLPNNNILAMFPRAGVYEINRKGDIVWSYEDSKISHDADRLPNGNTLVVFGANDEKRDVQVKEIDKRGNIVWAWHAKDYFNKSPYKDISWQGWTHTNAVSRLPNGNTLISLRNFCFIAEVNPQGSVVRTIGEGLLYSPHDPEVLSNGNILVANQSIPTPALKGYPDELARNIRQKQPRWHQAIELDPNTGTIVWQSLRFLRSDLPVRDADRLPNGNTLITTSNRLVEVTKEDEIVWELKVNFSESQPGDRARHGYYKAERIASH